MDQADRFQVWVFPTGEDIQQIFEATILGGSPLTSMARLATDPDEMARAVSNDPNAIGLITARLKSDTTTDAFIAASNLPVLAISRPMPSETLTKIIACLQQ